MNKQFKFDYDNPSDYRPFEPGDILISKENVGFGDLVVLVVNVYMDLHLRCDVLHLKDAYFSKKASAGYYDYNFYKLKNLKLNDELCKRFSKGR